MNRQLKPGPGVSASRRPGAPERLETSGFDDLYSAQTAEQGDRFDTGHAVVPADAVSEIFAEPLNDKLDTLGRIIEAQSAALSEHTARLEAASYRIGYLEALLAEKQEQVKLLPDLRSSAARAIVNERRAQELEQKVSALEEELARIRGAWWYRLTCWLLGK
ncbi:MAG TPA: hypothetical protein V6D08_11620 [Candidatus Obscuribacterales bacterium]